VIDKKCKDVEWWTPEHVLAAARETLGDQIDLDPATHASNPTKARRFFTRDDDGLSSPWSASLDVFVNPPYGKALLTWVLKIVQEARRAPGRKIVALLPGQRFETAVWQEFLLPCPCLRYVVFVRGRLRFATPSGKLAKSNPYGSMLYLFNCEPSRLMKALGHVQEWRPR